MRAIILAAALTATALPTVAAPVLWAGNNHYYLLSPTEASWEGALAAAALAGPAPAAGYSAPHLVTITSADENSFVSALAGTRFWAAGSDAAVEGEWRWVAGPEAGTIFWNGGPGGSSPTYANWDGPEPNNSGGNEDVLIGNWTGDRWNDLLGALPRGYVIEWSRLEVVPAPATAALLLAGLGVLAAARRRG